MEYLLEIDASLQPSPLIAGLVWAEEIERPFATDRPPDFLTEAVLEARRAGEEYVSAGMRASVRKMLRYGKYHPSGRGKPASEFLLRVALQNEFPLVNAPVDVNNVISLASGLPASIFDSDVSGTHLLIRRGHPGEAYLFNTSGQSIDLQDLVVVCRKNQGNWEPCGNPVKDSVATKISRGTKDVIAVIYAPVDQPMEVLGHWVEKYAMLLSSHCAAETTGYRIVEP
jgi:DNA/RNA-binding domain of Phe-tRNA-synthetase-like protein